MKKYFIYHMRWQLSGIIIAPCVLFLPFNGTIKVCVGNALGACVFWFVDKWIFSKKKLKKII
jgi:hypothetical protein